MAFSGTIICFLFLSVQESTVNLVKILNDLIYFLSSKLFMKDLIAKSLDDALQEGLILYVEELASQLLLRGIKLHHLVEATSALADTRGYPDAVINLLEKAAREAEKHESECSK